jgi:hypothetical protein
MYGVGMYVYSYITPAKIGKIKKFLLQPHTPISFACPGGGTVSVGAGKPVSHAEVKWLSGKTTIEPLEDLFPYQNIVDDNIKKLKNNVTKLSKLAKL